MPANIEAISVTATKTTAGDVRLDFYKTSDGLNPNGALFFAVVILSADFTSINTTVNGGASGATLTVTYPENARRVNYHNNYTPRA
jgi:hypothetical protein